MQLNNLLFNVINNCSRTIILTESYTKLIQLGIMEIDNQRVSQAILKIHHDEIVQDIQGDVIWALFEKQVLTEKEYEYINSQVKVYE